ncbi:MAG: tRNA (N(6)-L-threonylcarbamoyladenosine(37)-C(2))-methylthiotransferase MtaB, partial [Sporomusaceae bacterium]|nr:tRNA (N(6)-L-threonylcarbamoyladenosine(37)-C(2))-methylthiotransferase MtaB [Sporomusaceae bacterium]
QKTAEKIRRLIPGVAITTDIIVGFPGESEANFRNTVNFVQRIEFARAHIFPYSKRTGTPAANYPNQVDAQEKKRRAQILQEISKEAANKFQASFVGQQTEVLWENFASNTLDGLSGNYLRVYAAGQESAVGKLQRVMIEKFQDNKLWGKIL